MTFSQLELFDPMYPVPGNIDADAHPDEDGSADEFSAKGNKNQKLESAIIIALASMRNLLITVSFSLTSSFAYLVEVMLQCVK
jgi:hypothetical protein